jgi:hypothetical protein
VLLTVPPRDCSRSCSACRCAGDRVQSYHALHSLAELELDLGNLDAAAPLFSRSAEQAGEAGDRLLLTNIFHTAWEKFSLRETTSRGRRRHIEEACDCLSSSAFFAPLRPASPDSPWLPPASATRSRRASSGVRSRRSNANSGFPLLPFERTRYNRLIRAHADTHPAAFAAAVERGRGMSVGHLRGGTRLPRTIERPHRVTPRSHRVGS